jgi:hypothetical protein
MRYSDIIGSGKLERHKEHIDSARSHAHFEILSMERKAHREGMLPCATMSYQENTKLEGHKEHRVNARSAAPMWYLGCYR